jgi:hypothetical protein
MDNGFINILQKLVDEQGKGALTDAKKCKAFLADYTKNEYKKECRLILLAVDAGMSKVIDGADELAVCKKAFIRDLEEEGLNSAVAADIVNALALVLRGDKTVTASPSLEGKPSAQQTAAPVAPAPAAPAPAARSAPDPFAITGGNMAKPKEAEYLLGIYDWIDNGAGELMLALTAPAGMPDEESAQFVYDGFAEAMLVRNRRQIIYLPDVCQAVRNMLDKIKIITVAEMSDENRRIVARNWKSIGKDAKLDDCYTAPVEVLKKPLPIPREVCEKLWKR